MFFEWGSHYRYVLAIAILSSLYTGLQILRQIHELSTGREIISRKNLLIVDFIGDQVGEFPWISLLLCLDLQIINHNEVVSINYCVVGRSNLDEKGRNLVP